MKILISKKNKVIDDAAKINEWEGFLSIEKGYSKATKQMVQSPYCIRGLSSYFVEPSFMVAFPFISLLCYF